MWMLSSTQRGLVRLRLVAQGVCQVWTLLYKLQYAQRLDYSVAGCVECSHHLSLTDVPALCGCSRAWCGELNMLSVHALLCRVLLRGGRFSGM